MICCICGDSMNNYGNNPYPLCNKEDTTSRCCNECDQKVIQARMISMKAIDKTPEVGDTIVIFHSKKSNAPTVFIAGAGKFLAGDIQKIENNLYYGDWGNFPVAKDDSFIIV